MMSLIKLRVIIENWDNNTRKNADQNINWNFKVKCMVNSIPKEDSVYLKITPPQSLKQ